MRDEALTGWAALRRVVRPGTRWRRGTVAEGPWPDARRAAVWPLSQVLWAAVDLARRGWIDDAEVEELRAILATYADRGAYDPFPGERPRYVDDNAWLALDLLAEHDRTRDRRALAEVDRLARFLGGFEHPAGGLWWVESSRATRHTCSTAPAALVALGLRDAIGANVDDGEHELAEGGELLAFATRCWTFLDTTLRRDDDLFADKIDEAGDRDEAVYLYNQGTPVALAVGLATATTGQPDRARLDAARRTTRAVLDAFAPDGASVVGERLWRHEPCFVAIGLRSLLAVEPFDAALGAEVRALVRAYARRAWVDALDPRTGWFTEGGIGRYERGGVLDQAAVVSLLALAGDLPGDPPGGR